MKKNTFKSVFVLMMALLMTAGAFTGCQKELDENGNEISVNALEKLEYMEYLAGLEKQTEGLSSNLLSNITSSNNILIILVVGLFGLTAILGYYFLNKKRYAR